MIKKLQKFFQERRFKKFIKNSSLTPETKRIWARESDQVFKFIWTRRGGK